MAINPSTSHVLLLRGRCLATGDSIAGRVQTERPRGRFCFLQSLLLSRLFILREKLQPCMAAGVKALDPQVLASLWITIYLTQSSRIFRESTHAAGNS